MSDAAKWELFHLLKVLDTFHEGELHDELASVAQGLGLELPAMAAPLDPVPDGEDEASQQDRVLQFLAAQTEPATLGRIIAELGLKKWSATSALYQLQRKGSVEHPAHDAWQVRKCAADGSEGAR